MSPSRRVIRRVIGAGKLSTAPVYCGEDGGLFGLLDDDVLVLLFAAILVCGGECTGLTDVQQAAHAARTLLALATTCKRIGSVLERGGKEYKIEALARCSTTIPPLYKGPFAFTQQVRAEENSDKQLKLLRNASQSMVLHCAKPGCCGRMQKAFNRDQQRSSVGGSVVAAMDTCSLITASRDGNVVFAYARRRLSRIAVHGEERGRRFQDCIIQATKNALGAVTTTAVVDISLDACSEPQTMRCDEEGSVVAYTSVLHTTSDSSAPISKLEMWKPNAFGPVAVTRRGMQYGVQDAWFAGAGVGPLLYVAWTNGYFHPSGHDLGYFDELADSVYLFSTYTFCGNEPELDTEGMGRERRALLTCSPTARGNKVLALAQCRVGHGLAPEHPGWRRAYVVDLDNDTEQFTGLSTFGKDKGLVCASLSPAGDAVVALDDSKGTYTLDVLVCGNDLLFTRVQRMDLSPFLALCPGNNPLMSDMVKVAFRIEISPCGRFAAVVDRRPLFGDPASNYATVFVDMRNRMSTGKKLRALPMFNCDEQAPRDLCWAQTSVWFMSPGTDESGSISPRGGALCLKL